MKKNLQGPYLRQRQLLYDYYIDYQRLMYLRTHGSLNARLEDKGLDIRTEQDMTSCKEFWRKENLFAYLGGSSMGTPSAIANGVSMDLSAVPSHTGSIMY